MSTNEEPPATGATTQQASAAMPDDTNLRVDAQTGAATTGHSPDNTVGNNGTDSGVPQPEAAHAAAPTTPPTTTGTNPFEDAEAEPTPALPPRPAEEHTMATSTTAAEPPSSVTNTNVQNPEAPPSTNVQTNENVQGAVSPQVEALRAMFPDFDVAVLQSVLESVNNDQERALDVLLGMSDPEYVSTQTAAQPAPSQMDLDEQLARQLLMEDQQQQRHASGTSWPRRSEDVPYQARQHHPEPNRLPSPEGGVGKSDFQELQRTMGQIAESGKRTFSSIVSRVKAKINEYDQSRNGSGQSSGSSTTPQWGSAPPTQIDRHTASQAYQQQYFGPGSTTQSQYNPDAEPHQISLQDNTQVTGYNVDAPSTRNQPQPLAAPVPTPAARSTSPVASGLSPAASPRPSSDVPRPPPTVTGSPVNAAKIGLLPKKPVSLLNTNSPPATRPSDDDDELEYVENPFEERK